MYICMHRREDNVMVGLITNSSFVLHAHAQVLLVDCHDPIMLLMLLLAALMLTEKRHNGNIQNGRT